MVIKFIPYNVLFSPSIIIIVLFRSTKVKGMTQLFWLVLNMGVEVLVIGLLRVQSYWYALLQYPISLILRTFNLVHGMMLKIITILRG